MSADPRGQGPPHDPAHSLGVEHPTLAALDAHRVSPDPGVAEHLVLCAPCAATLATLAAQAALVGELRAVLHPADLARQSLAPPDIDGYEVLAPVSSGGQGVVWRARQRSTRREVALKLLVGAQHATLRTRARFEREVELAAALHHPHIVTVFDSGVTSTGAQWFAMEFVEGAPFTRWARSAARGRDEVLAALIRLCRAVDFAHRRGVLHRDLKPSNVLVDAEGAPHVLDFGLAAPSAPMDDEDARLTLTGEFMGTLAYASPEHLTGAPRRIEVRSDVYSLGVIAYEALTGLLPHDTSGDTFRVAQRIRSEPVERAALRGLPTDLATVVMVALATDPERRYATAGALADDIERFLGGEALDARRDSALYVLRKSVARHRGKVLAVGAVFAVSVAAAIVSTTLWRRSERDRVTAVTEADRAAELSGFWRTLFDSLDPDLARGRRLDVYDVLDEAARKMRAAPPSAPLAELELCASIGRTYHKLGRDDLAWPHLKRVAELARAHLAARDRACAALNADAATVALAAAPLDEAQAAVAALEHAHVEPHTKGYLRARLAQRAGDDAAALAELERARTALAASPAPDPMGALGVLNAMSDVALARRRFGDAAALGRQALALAQARRGDDALLAWDARYRVAVAEAGRGNIDLALTEARGVSAAFQQAYGATDARAITAASAVALARGRHGQGRLRAPSCNGSRLPSLTSARRRGRTPRRPSACWPTSRARSVTSSSPRGPRRSSCAAWPSWKRPRRPRWRSRTSRPRRSTPSCAMRRARRRTRSRPCRRWRPGGSTHRWRARTWRWRSRARRAGTRARSALRTLSARVCSLGAKAKTAGCWRLWCGGRRPTSLPSPATCRALKRPYAMRASRSRPRAAPAMRSRGRWRPTSGTCCCSAWPRRRQSRCCARRSRCGSRRSARPIRTRPTRRTSWAWRSSTNARARRSCRASGWRRSRPSKPRPASARRSRAC
ncbi:MAG: serine/threonine-protein kinase [Planctomycetota bacterium]